MLEETAPATEIAPKAAKPAVNKTAQVIALKVIRYGNFTCAPGHKIEAMDFDEASLRVSSGEVQLVKVN
jgi:hypothetical protein